MSWASPTKETNIRFHRTPCPIASASLMTTIFGACEVTQGEFQKLMGRNPSWHSYTGEGRRLLAAKKVTQDTSRYPVESVTWDQADEFCKRMSQLPEERAAGHVYRLPTEAEWTARAGPVPASRSP